MKIGIIAAMPEELIHLTQNLDKPQEVQVLGNTYYTGSVGNTEVVLVQSGIGKVMSAMSVAVLANHFQVEAIINTGSAGGLAEGIAVGDVVIADKLVYHDVDVTAFGYAYGQMAGQPLYFESDKNFIARIKENLSKLEQNWHLGLIATGDSFIAGDDKIASIKSHFPDVLAVEMETAGLYTLAAKYKAKALSILTISDSLVSPEITSAEEREKTFSEMIELALEIATRM